MPSLAFNVVDFLVVQLEKEGRLYNCTSQLFNAASWMPDSTGDTKMYIGQNKKSSVFYVCI